MSWAGIWRCIPKKCLTPSSMSSISSGDRCQTHGSCLLNVVGRLDKESFSKLRTSVIEDFKHVCAAADCNQSVDLIEG